MKDKKLRIIIGSILLILLLIPFVISIITKNIDWCMPVLCILIVIGSVIGAGILIALVSLILGPINYIFSGNKEDIREYIWIYNKLVKGWKFIFGRRKKP